MDVLEIVLQVLGALICALGDAFLTNLCRNTGGESYFARKEKENEKEAGEKRTVKMSKGLTAAFIVCLIIIHIAEVLILVCKSFITRELGNYWAVLTIWTAAVALDDVFVYALFTKAYYDDEKIVVLKPLQKAKTYYFDEIESYTFSGNLKVKTANGSFTLLNALSGTDTLRGIIINKIAHKNSVEN